MRGLHRRISRKHIGETKMLTQQIIQGDCKDVLPTLPADSVDLVDRSAVLGALQGSLWSNPCQ